MKKHLIKILLLAVLLTVPKINRTNSFFSSGLVLSSNTFSTGYWTLPSAPTNLRWVNPSISCGGYTNSFTATATWDSVASATSYMYEIDYPPLSGGRAIWQNPVINPDYSGAFNQAEGLHTFHVYAIDSVGKTSPWSSSCSVTYDKTLPSSVINAPVYSTNQDNVIEYPIIYHWDGQLNGTATDNLSGVDRVELSIQNTDANLFWNGTSWVSGTESTVRVIAVGTTTWSYQIGSTFSSTTKFKIVSHAVDKAGNIENSATIKFENIASIETIIPTDTITPTPTDSIAPTPTSSEPAESTPTPTDILTPTPTETITPTPTDTITPTPTDSIAPTPTEISLPTPTETPVPTETPASVEPVSIIIIQTFNC